MSDDAKKTPKLGRRDSLKLATAVTALGAGLSIVLDADDAIAGYPVKWKATDIGNFTVKLFKLDGDGKAHTLLDTIDVSALASKMSKSGSYSLKMYNHKLDAAVMISEQIDVQPVTVAPTSPAVPAPPTLKR